MVIKSFLNRKIDIASLAAFRVLFGAIMLGSMLRFLAKGWVDSLYVKPSFFFHYYGFSWVTAWPAWGMYLHVILLALLALFISLGLFYRGSMLLFFFGFTYFELIDKTNYLNHYYFISLISLLMIFMPLHKAYSLDAWRKAELRREQVPAWPLYALRLQISIVYFFAAIAKINSDWLLHAQPLKIWLSANSDFPILGRFFAQAWTAYAMSWMGFLFDLTIPFFLSFKKTRIYAYSAVFVFHLLTWKLFRIGMFPWIMMLATLVFFEADWPRKIWRKLRHCEEPAGRRGNLSRAKPEFIAEEIAASPTAPRNDEMGSVAYVFLAIYFLIQILMPLRNWLYPGYVCWTEQGFNFSWRVMLMEKNGNVEYRIVDPGSGKHWRVSPAEYLKPHQVKQMSTQPDMILAFAKHLQKEFSDKGFSQVQIYADAFASLNGRSKQRLIDPQVDLTKQQDSLKAKPWILPFEYSEVP